MSYCLILEIRLIFIFVACYKSNRVVYRGKVNMKNRKEKETRNMKLVTVLIPEANLNGLDDLVRSGMYGSRSSVIRSAVRDLLKRELYFNNNSKSHTKE